MSHRLFGFAALWAFALLLPAPGAARPRAAEAKSDRPAAAASQPASAGTSRAAASEEPGKSKLEPSPAARAAVSGKEQPASLSTGELEELRKFEESAFPKPLKTPDASSVVEGPAPLPPAPRPAAESPPPGLQSDSHVARPAKPPPATPPEPWLAKLQLPDLPLRWDPKLIRYLEFYRSSPKGRAIMGVWLRRLGRYQKLITAALHRHKLPKDLIYVAMIESGFSPKVTSRRGAAGVWQFMPKAGLGYGLRRDHWIDERRNPELSTEAAAKFLKDLHDRFGTWELALASYNAGYFGVTRAIQKYNTNDYWQLCRYEAGLPWDTGLYVPKILAAAIVGRNRTFFGFDQIKAEPELSHALVSVPSSITVAQAAAAAGVSREVIEQLNAELRRGRTPPAPKGWLRVPKGSEDRFYAGLAGIKGQLARYKPYVVRLGDTEEAVARRAGLTRAALRQINGLEKPTDLRPGLTILVPARMAPSTQPVSVQDGEEEPILVALPKDRPAALPGRKRVFYRVVPGDTLGEIGVGLQVTTVDLATWNALDPAAKLIPGMVLQAFVHKGFDESRVVLLDPQRLKLMTAGSADFLSAYEERKGRKRLVYTVRDGDTVSSVSRRFGLTVGSLMRINQFDRRAQLKPGQPIIVYVSATRARQKAVTSRKPVRVAAAPASRPARRAATPEDAVDEESEEAGDGEAAEVDPSTEAEDTAAAKKQGKRAAAADAAEKPAAKKATKKKRPAAEAEEAEQPAAEAEQPAAKKATKKKRPAAEAEADEKAQAEQPAKTRRTSKRSPTPARRKAAVAEEAPTKPAKRKVVQPEAPAE